MKIGFIGLKKSGKTTIFNALTRMDITIDQYSSAKDEPNVAVVHVADPRITRLSEMYKPKKTTHAALECIDFGGFRSEGGSEKKEVFSASELGLIKTADALGMVVRNFHDQYIDSLLGEPDPLSEIDGIVSELILADLILVETRLERIEHQISRDRKNAGLDLERDALEKVREFLDKGDLSITPSLSPDEEKVLRGFRFLTLKPMLVILNSDEDTFGRNAELLGRIWQDYRGIEFAGRFEMDLSRLDAHEATEFMEDMGISASAQRPAHPGGLRVAGLYLVLHRGRRRGACLDRPQGRHGPRCRGSHPLGPGPWVHPGRMLHLRRPYGPRFREGAQG